MNKGDSITLRKVANGWTIEPECIPAKLMVYQEIHVFQKMGYASGDETAIGDKTLLGWIEAHFTGDEK